MFFHKTIGFLFCFACLFVCLFSRSHCRRHPVSLSSLIAKVPGVSGGKWKENCQKGRQRGKGDFFPLFLPSPLRPLKSPFPYPPGKSCYSGQAIKANKALTLSLGLVGGAGCPSSPESFNVLPLELL